MPLCDNYQLARQTERSVSCHRLVLVSLSTNRRMAGDLWRSIGDLFDGRPVPPNTYSVSDRHPNNGQDIICRYTDRAAQGRNPYTANQQSNEKTCRCSKN